MYNQNMGKIYATGLKHCIVCDKDFWGKGCAKYCTDCMYKKELVRSRERYRRRHGVSKANQKIKD